MRHPVTDVALLAYIAKKNVDVLSYTDATRACKSSSSASRALHQLIKEGLLDPQPKLLGLRYVTQYVVTERGRQVAQLALQLTQLREVAAKATKEGDQEDSPGQKEELGEASAPVNNSQLPTAAATPSEARISKSLITQTESRSSSSENGRKLAPLLQKGVQDAKKRGRKKREDKTGQASERALGGSNKRKKKASMNYNGE